MPKSHALASVALGTLFAAACCVAQAAGPATAPGWGTTLERDVRAFHAALRERHPGPVDPENPAFGRQLDAALERALQRVPATRDYGGYWWALREFRAAFNDGHVQLVATDTAPALASRWPGFLTRLRGGAHEVAVRLDAPGLPAEGARLLDCDGVAADRLAEKRLGSFYGRWQLAAQREALAGRLFIDAGNPWVAAPGECRFEQDGEVVSFKLQWRGVDGDRLATLLARVRGAAPAWTGVRSLDGGRVLWIPMPGFDADLRSEDHAALTAILQALGDGRQVAAARRVVLDVRGNGGGSSHWSREIAALLWGDAAVRAQTDGSSAVEWRVSQANLDRIRAFRAMLLGQEAPDPKLLRWTAMIGEGMEAALARGDALWRQPQDDVKPSGPSPERPRQLAAGAKVVVLTDSACASACLDALDLWLPLGAVHAGGETSADTLYMEIGSQSLPSGLSHVGLPMKVYRGRPRGNNQPYVPARPYPANPDDDRALEAWIRTL